MSNRHANIVVPPDLSRKVKALLDMVAPVQAAAIDKHLRPVFERAQANWPVRKARYTVKGGMREPGGDATEQRDARPTYSPVSQDSKGKLALEYTVVGGAFKATLINRAPYAWYINNHRTALGLIFVPARKAVEKVAPEIAAEFERRLVRGL